MLENLNEDSLLLTDGGVSIGTIVGGVCTTIGGVVAIAVPEPASTAGGIVAVGAGITTIVAGIVD